ncbi:hypothetical protein DSM104299_03761 [Baekduia alba]|uniref:hypothetical protein n=1 Tax=Baekduia alba TaxID=2997333 RepID=UPI002340256D|nr:hypothetical protein [Baekduia alba]WCB95019.1 hypothetical protein DSM104299_03761 [Baekduia alba]
MGARARRLAAALAVLALVAFGGAPLARADIGISDSRVAMLSDWRFTDLGVGHVRLVVPWDIAVDHPEATDAFLRAARASGVDVHVAFEHIAGDQCPSLPCTLPSVTDYRTALVAFRDRWPWVTSFTTWNEASHETQPTQHDPGRAAAYYDTLVDACPTCEVVAADVLGGDPGLPQWLAAFRTAARHPPALYGLHDYSDADRRSTADLDGMLSTIGGARLWITETGGIVRFRTRDGVETMGYDPARAARAVAFALGVADAYGTLVPRTYIYSFTGGGRMDTGLIGLDGATRPAYDVLLQYQRAHQVPPLPRPPGQEQSATPPWDQRGRVDPATGRATGGGKAGAGGIVTGPRRLVVRSPRVRRSGRLGLRLLLSCPAGAPRCVGHVRASGLRRAAYRVRAGGRATVLLHCARRRPRSGTRLRLAFTQTGVAPWHARVTVR